MKRLLTLTLVLLLSSAALYAQEEAMTESSDDGLGITVGMDYMSNYLWRGTYWYSGQAAFFPYASYEVAGLTISVAGEISESYLIDTDDTNEDLQAFDAGIDYSYALGDMATLSAGVWGFFLKESDYNFMTGTVAVSFDSVPLAPFISYTHDYYMNADENELSDFYIQLGVGHSIALTDEASLDLGLAGAYYNAESTDQKGISDIEASTGLSVAVGSVTLSGSFAMVFVPADDFKTGLGADDDVFRTYSTFGAAYSF